MGKQTLESTKDEKLKKDMPPTFVTVSDASIMLLDASKGLAEDMFSKPHKALLMDGARGKETKCVVIYVRSVVWCCCLYILM